jgi:hypothetical protein
MSDVESAAASAEPAPNPGTVVTPLAAAAAAAPAVAGGTSFTFVSGSTTYTVEFWAPDSVGQYGMTLTQTPASGTRTTVASFVFAPNATPADSWEIKAGLPSSLQIGGLTISSLSVDLKKGTVQPLTPPS